MCWLGECLLSPDYGFSFHNKLSSARQGLWLASDDNRVSLVRVLTTTSCDNRVSAVSTALIALQGLLLTCTSGMQCMGGARFLWQTVGSSFQGQRIRSGSFSTFAAATSDGLVECLGCATGPERHSGCTGQQRRSR